MNITIAQEEIFRSFFTYTFKCGKELKLKERNILSKFDVKH